MSASAPLAAAPSVTLGECTLDLAADVLRDAEGRIVELRPQAFAVLRVLGRHAGQLVSKEQLLEAVWPGLVVTDDSLVQAVSAVREALGEAGRQAIRTVPRRGYMLMPGRSGGAAIKPPGAESADEPAPPKAPDWPSIAVLAFRDPTGDAAGQWLARGFAEDLLAELARNADLRVVSHHSSFAFADTDTPLAEVGRRLRCRYLADGSVRREGDTLRIAVELIDSQSGEIVWTARHTAGSATVLAERDALVHRIAGTLHNSARLADARSILARPPKSMDAYALTARAVALRHYSFRPDKVSEARMLFERALQIDPDYAPAWAYLAELNAVEAMVVTDGFGPTAGHRVLEQARRAIALEPDNPMAYRVLSYGHRLCSEFESQRLAARRSVELAPSNADNVFALGFAEFQSGHVAASLQALDEALDFYPLPPPWVLNTRGAALTALGRHEEAVASIEQAMTKAPHFWPCRSNRLVALVGLGRLEEARAEAAALLQQVPTLTIEGLLSRYADDALDLRGQWLHALRTVGFPEGRSPPAA